MYTDPRLIAFARQMRHESSPTEQLMWRLLRDRRLAGFRFRRQHPIPPYIADYYCAVARLVVELDGESHIGNEEADRVRKALFASQGLRLIRFWNTEVFDDQDAVLEAVYQACFTGAQDNPKVRHKIDGWGQFRSGHEDPSPPAPLPNGERGERGLP